MLHQLYEASLADKVGTEDLGKIQNWITEAVGLFLQLVGLVLDNGCKTLWVEMCNIGKPRTVA